MTHIDGYTRFLWKSRACPVSFNRVELASQLYFLHFLLAVPELSGRSAWMGTSPASGFQWGHRLWCPFAVQAVPAPILAIPPLESPSCFQEPAVLAFRWEVQETL